MVNHRVAPAYNRSRRLRMINGEPPLRNVCGEKAFPAQDLALGLTWVKRGAQFRF